MFFGMSMATAFGIFIIPGLYVVLQTNRERAKRVLGYLFLGKHKEVTPIEQAETEHEAD
jgi:hypothetical protein